MPVFYRNQEYILNAKQSILNNIKNGTFALLTDEQIAKKLRLGKKETNALRDILHALVREGELLHDSRFRFGTAEQFEALEGTITGNERGFGFFVPHDGSGDLFIPHRSLQGALHGDIVLACCVGGRDGDEGEVLAILKRGYTEIVGTYYCDRKVGYLVPDEKKFSENIFIPAGKQNKTPDGSKAVARITSWSGKTPSGEIIEVLGREGDFFTEEKAIIRSHNLRTEFPQEVWQAANEQEKRNPSYDLEGRIDLRDRLIITVDSEDTRDIDDAISIQKNGDFYELGVHIADVTHYVERNHAIDKEAFRRGTSVYFPDRVIPMLPPALSNGICSLNEGVDRLTLSCFMTVDRFGTVVKKHIVPSIIRSAHRMTYTNVKKIYERDEAVTMQYPDLTDFVDTAIELTNILKNAREARGGVALDVKEAKILYSNGKISIPNYQRSIAHEMIEQFMVLANESVATIMTECEMPFVYRVHERPTVEKATEFLTFLKEAGVRARFDPEKVTPKDYQTILNSIEGSPIYSLINRVMLRSMMKAHYSPENCGHFGLASDCYCHFTSPIRRYPDLCIHRIIKEALKNPEHAKDSYRAFVFQAATQSSKCEKNAADTEREVDALYITAYMQDKIGEEYDATVSGVTSYGLYAELANTVEGFLAIDLLPDDYYEFVEERFLLRGMRNAFSLGQSLKVKVVGVDWGMRRVLFSLAEGQL